MLWTPYGCSNDSIYSFAPNIILRSVKAGLGAENASATRGIDKALLKRSLIDMALRRGRYGNPWVAGKNMTSGHIA
jgi:hypothetical protein